jgi:hypothetical protein
MGIDFQPIIPFVALYLCSTLYFTKYVYSDTGNLLLVGRENESQFTKKGPRQAVLWAKSTQLNSAPNPTPDPAASGPLLIHKTFSPKDSLLHKRIWGTHFFLKNDK